MTYEKAAKGLGFIFWLKICSYALILIMTGIDLLTKIPDVALPAEEIVHNLLMIVGLWLLSKDHQSGSVALMVQIVNVLLYLFRVSVPSAILQWIAMLGGIICELTVFNQVLSVISGLTYQLDRREFDARGKSIWKMLIIDIVISCVGAFLFKIASHPPLAAQIVLIVIIVAVFGLGITVDIRYIIHLRKAQKVLKAA